jgi:hypothetical protein
MELLARYRCCRFSRKHVPFGHAIVVLGTQRAGETIPLMEPSGCPSYIHCLNRGAILLLKARKSKGALIAAAVAAAGLVLTPAIAAAQAKKRPPKIALSFDAVSGFTPAAADPRLAAAFGGRGVSLSDFKFTPSAAKARPSQVRVAIRARANSPSRVQLANVAASTSASPISALTPASYNLGAAVGWRRFAISGDVAKTRAINPAIGNRESAAVGVSYSLKRFTGRVAVGAERADPPALTELKRNENYSLDVGGAYSITRNIAVTGGVRYRIDNERVSTLNDDRRDSQAVYVGTAFKF